MDETGRRHRKLTTPHLRHYPDDDSSELDRPVLTVFKEGAPPWVIRSETGWISDDGDEIILQGRVFIDREAGEGTRPVHIKTRELRVRPEEEYAQTDELVEITSDADWLTSMNGARVWFGETSKIDFVGRVHALLDVD
jgi:lipopolysaccharide export system protein LptC